MCVCVYIRMKIEDENKKLDRRGFSTLDIFLWDQFLGPASSPQFHQTVTASCDQNILAMRSSFYTSNKQTQ